MKIISNTDSIDNMSSTIAALSDSGMPGNVRLIKPLGYLDMLVLMANARKILTDSGGIQKEAYMLGVPCVTLRENTEWVETLEGGWNVLVGADKGKIFEAISNMAPMGEQRNIFGNSRASERILDNLRGEM